MVEILIFTEKNTDVSNLWQPCVSFLLDAMYSSYQAISSGLLQEDGPGIKDPCEREQVRKADLLSFIFRFGVCCTTLFGFCFFFDN